MIFSKKIKIIFIAVAFVISSSGMAQYVLSGAVFDESTYIPVKDVKVMTTSGKITYTDSLGKYKILIQEKDSISFYYNNKSTLKFSVASIDDYSNFFVSIKIKAFSKYKTLPEVVVQNKTYRQDSMERRERYAEAFGFEKPGIGVTSNNGVAGLDLDEFIKMFQFRRNKSRASFRNFLIRKEQEDYIDYRFSRKLVQRLSGGFDSTYLEMFMKFYRPNYEFISAANDIQLIEYIKKSIAIFKESFPESLKKETKK